jgi:hypothetical protein
VLIYVAEAALLTRFTQVIRPSPTTAQALPPGWAPGATLTRQQARCTQRCTTLTQFSILGLRVSCHIDLHGKLHKLCRVAMTVLSFGDCGE